MMTASELKNKKRRRTSPKSAHPVNKQSWLERLPAELLEQIFFHSLEPNMALASPLLYRALSKESIYRVLILYALFRDDEEHPVEEKNFAPAEYRVLGADERLRLQKRVLNSRWCTLARLRHCLPTLTRLVIVQEWHRYREMECKQQENTMSQDGHNQQQERVSILPLDDVSAVHIFFGVDDPVRALDQLKDQVSRTKDLNYRRILKVDYIPNRLIDPISWHNSTNPQNDNVQPVEFLTLFYHGLSKGWLDNVSDSVDIAAIHRGIETAVRERSRDALDLLLEIYEDLDYVLDANAPIQLPVEVLHQATRQGKDSEWILDTLVQYMKLERIIAVPEDDKVLTKWALEQSEAGSRFGMWLLEFLRVSKRDRLVLWRAKSHFISGRVQTLAT